MTTRKLGGWMKTAILICCLYALQASTELEERRYKSLLANLNTTGSPHNSCPNMNNFGGPNIPIWTVIQDKLLGLANICFNM